MSSDNDMADVKQGVGVVTEIIKAAGNDPKVKEASSNLGDTAITITKTINNALLPLAAINFGFEKAREYFDQKFHNDLSEKASKIPHEDLIQPRSSVAGPTLQGLAFTHEEEDLKEMFLNLLANSMNGRKAQLAHPAFAEIIKQLDSEEARVIKNSLLSEESLPIVDIALERKKEGGKRSVQRHLMNLRDGETDMPIENLNVQIMVDNWIRLGLITVDYDRFLMSENAYDWVEGRPEYISISKSLNYKELKIVFDKGVLQWTALGIQFLNSVGLK